MKFTIVGPGAIGILIGGLLHNKGYDVEFICKNSEQIDKLKGGMRITGLINYEFKPSLKLEYQGKSDYVFFTVKSYDTENALKKFKNVENEIGVTLQNGIGNHEIIRKKFKKVVVGVTSCGSTRIRVNTINFVGRGTTKFGSPYSEENEAERLAEIFNKIGLPSSVSHNIIKDLWLKAAVNSVINSITSAFCIKNGEILRNKNLRNLAKIASIECEKSLKKIGYNLNVMENIFKIAEDTAENISSTLQDILNGKRTEVDYFLKPIIQINKSEILEALYYMVKSRERVKCPE